MANESSYIYAGPGGFAPPPHSVHLKKYVDPDEVGRPVADFVTLSGIVDFATSPLGIATGLAAAWWWFKGRRRK